MYLIYCFDCKHCSKDDTRENDGFDFECNKIKAKRKFNDHPCNYFKIRYTNEEANNE